MTDEHTSFGVILDLDGTLVDSEPLVNRGWAELLSRYLGHLPPDFQTLQGYSFERRYRWASGFGRLPPADKLREELDDTICRLFARDRRVFPDALRLLRRLKRTDTATGLATQASRRRLKVFLQIAELEPYFKTTVCSEDVRQPKPAPDIYVTAAARLGLPCDHCIVVEDTPVGAAAARAAGCTVIAVARHPESEPALAEVAHVTVRSLEPAHLTSAVVELPRWVHFALGVANTT